MEKNDLIELARICLKHARATSVRRAAAALKRMARDYQRRAGLLGRDTSPHRTGPDRDGAALPRPMIAPDFQERLAASCRFRRPAVWGGGGGGGGGGGEMRH